MPTTKLLNLDYFQENSTHQIMVGDRLLSSHQAGWQNIVLEHWSRAPHETPVYYSKQHTIEIHLKTEKNTERKLDGVFRQENIQIGDIVLIPAHVEHWARFQEDAELLILSFAADALATTIYDDAFDLECVEFIPQFAHPDPTIEQFAQAILAELQTDYYGCQLYAETLANAMFVHLVRKYSTFQPQIKKYQDGLSGYRLKQALNYIHDHLGNRNLTLREIAQEIHISQYYFARLFKKSLGITPHQYVVQQRIEKAKQLLKQKIELPIADIALECGFSHQSHLNNCFRQITKMTPSVYRQSYQN